MMLSAISLAALIASCAPAVAPDTMNAIIQVESSGNPFALHDNTTARAYAPQNRAMALAIAQTLIRRRHSVDVGLGQVNSANFAAYHVGIEQMLDPCTNLQVASRILQSAYERAYSVERMPTAALWGAISAYNTGSIFAGRAYVAAVVAQAEHAPVVPAISLLTREAINTAPADSPPSAPAHAKIRSNPPTTPAAAPLGVPLVQAARIRTLSNIQHSSF